MPINSKTLTECGSFRIYEDKGAPNVLNFVGIEHPISEEQVIPTLQKVLDRTIERLQLKADEGMVYAGLQETIGFLETLLELTVPEQGYICCPDVSEETKGILTKYGKKLLEKENE